MKRAKRAKAVSPARRRSNTESAVGKVAYASAYRDIDFRAQPELYRVGRGEQGVLIAEPYKSELLPLWRFKTEAQARASAQALWQAFVGYRRVRDYVGMDMAREYLQMGFTRARRYANRSSGRKYSTRASEIEGDAPAQRAVLPRSEDAEKAKAASVFYGFWQKAERDLFSRMESGLSAALRVTKPTSLHALSGGRFSDAQRGRASIRCQIMRRIARLGRSCSLSMALLVVVATARAAPPPTSEPVARGAGEAEQRTAGEEGVTWDALEGQRQELASHARLYRGPPKDAVPLSSRSHAGLAMAGAGGPSLGNHAGEE